jgi:hypothetical protein
VATIGALQISGFVVNVVDPLGLSTWLKPSQFGGFTFGPRETMKIFGTKAEAQNAISDLPSAFHSHGFRFTVELAE